MLDIYQYHVTPETLLGHGEHWRSTKLAFYKALTAVNAFRVDEEDSAPLKYIAKSNGERLDIEDEGDNNKVIGHIVRQGNYCVLYNGDELVDSHEGDSVPYYILTEFIHVLSGVW